MPNFELDRVMMRNNELNRNIEYLRLLIKTKIRKIKSIIGYVIRNKSFKAPYREPWYSDVCKHFKITPKEALLIAASKNRPTMKVWEEWDANKEVVEESEKNVIQTWKNSANDFIIRNCWYRESTWMDWNRELTLLNYKSGEAILDYGCGVTSFTKWALAKFDMINITLAELDGPMLDFLKWRFGEKVKYISIKVGEINLNGKYDVIRCLDVLEHVWSPLELCNEFVRILKDDGRLIETYIDDDRGSNLIKSNKERKEVFSYLTENMRLVYGNLNDAGPRIWVKE